MRFFLKVSLFILILVLGILAIAIYHTFYGQLPDHTAVIQTEGISEKVDVHWDPYGIPYIYAANDEDLYFTIGYLHAQDRLWQLTLSQLMAEGRFSEYLGSEFIELDKHQRTLGIWKTARKIEQQTPDSLLNILQRYAEGVNTFVRQNPDKQPIEFSILGLEAPEWTPTHSIAISRLMAWDQNMYWKSEITLAHIGAEIGAGRLNQIYPNLDSGILSYNNMDNNILKDIYKTFLSNEFSIRKRLQKQGSAVGSNAWAVNSRKTSAGLPILAGDPHMGLSMPGFWYEIGANTPEHSISGATIPGAPFVVLGQNSSIAWSITNMMADDTDFFLIRTDPSGADRYVADSLNGEAVFNEFEWQQEIIKVDGADDYFLRIPHTQYGPIINDIHPDSSAMGITPVAMRWTGHEVSQELWAIYKMNRAGNLEQFTDALSHFGSPAMNFIYADKNDNIALIGAGNLPVRNGIPTMFRKSWNSEHRWQGWIPFEDLPGEVNPERGFVANANNKVAQDDFPHYIGRFFASGSRITRIGYLLDGNDELDSEAMKQIQNDIYSEHAAEMLEILIPLLRSVQEDDEFSTALTYLQNWDFEYSRSSTAATIFDLFFMNVSELILKRVIPDEHYEGLIRLEYIPVNMVSHILSDGSSFFNVVDEENLALRDETIRNAMQLTLDQLNRQLGPEPFEWRWESLHTLSLRPPLLGEISDHPESPATLRIIVNNLLSTGPHTVPGHGMTINKGEYSWNDPFEVTLGPSIRRIVDFSTPSKSFSVLPTGQSGQSLSANYGDQTDLWLEGRYRFVYNDSTFFNEINYKTMKLEPLSIQ